MKKYYETPSDWFEAEGIDNYRYTGEFTYIDIRRVELYRYKNKDSWFVNNVWFIQEIEGWRLVDTDIELHTLFNSGEVI